VAGKSDQRPVPPRRILGDALQTQRADKQLLVFQLHQSLNKFTLAFAFCARILLGGRIDSSGVCGNETAQRLPQKLRHQS
jgi:hypothetical protein